MQSKVFFFCFYVYKINACMSKFKVCRVYENFQIVIGFFFLNATFNNRTGQFCMDEKLLFSNDFFHYRIEKA